MDDGIEQHLAAGRHPRAFDLLVPAYRDRVFRLAFSILKERAAAEDATQETLVRVVAPAANVGSMPSLHSANAFAVATVTALLVPRAGWVTYPLAALIAISRVGVGVHWPSDILAGAVIGSVVGWVVVRLARRWMPAVPRPAAPPRPAVEQADPAPKA